MIEEQCCYRQTQELASFINQVLKLNTSVTAEPVAAFFDRYAQLMKRHNDGKLPYTSLLTPNGSPIEINFRADDGSLCLTLDPMIKGIPIKNKLLTIQNLLDENISHNKTLASLTNIDGQRFGTWLSMRYASDSVGYKIYSEIPQSHNNFFRKQLLDQVPSFPVTVSFTPMLVGILPESDGISEYYFRLDTANASILHQLCAITGNTNQVPFLMDTFSWLSSTQTSQVFERLAIGASISIKKTSQPTLTFFVHCPQIFASNEQARHKILLLAKQIGIEMSTYETATSTSSFSAAPPPLHSVLSIKLEKRNKVSLSVGVSPF